MPVKAVQRDVGETRARIASWLSSRLGRGAVEVGELRAPAATGATNETLMFDATWTEDADAVTRGFVLRLDNVTSPLFLESPAHLHYEVQQVLAEQTDIPVAPVVGYEADPSWFGVPFYVMDRIHGRVPNDQPPFNVEGWVVDLTTDERRTMWRNVVTVMAAMHTLDHHLFPMLRRGPDGTALEQEVDRWVRHLAWTFGDASPDPVLSAAATWLRAHLPADAAPGFAWGDARLANVLFGPDGTVNAVLDWDMVSLAGGESDLAWYCVCHHHQAAITGLPPLDGFGTPAETIALWEQLVGRAPRDWQYHVVFAAYRLALVMARVAKLLAAAGLAEAAEHIAAGDAAIPFLAQILGLPWDGPVTHHWPGLDD